MIMMLKKHIIAEAFSLASLVILFLGLVHGAMITSCSQTPYPEVCNHFINNYNLPSTSLDETRLEFHDFVHKVTLNQAIEAHRLISVTDLNAFLKPGSLAWNDCLELYENTVFQLNRSMSTNNPTDALTWISASLANHHTCKYGFVDLNMSSNLESFPNILLSNFSKLLSNTLAVKKAEVLSSTMLKSKKSINGGARRLLSDGLFPTWFSAAERKLLESSGSEPKADIVVAKDGSGDYTTISEAVDASASGSGRFIIHVKAGVYKESVEIKKSNLMITGDGIGSTIVTGNGNVKGGATTFRSATFGESRRCLIMKVLD